MRKYPDDPAKEVFEAANSGDADLLNEVLQQMNVNERASALEKRSFHVIRRAHSVLRPYRFRRPPYGTISIKSTPLTAAAMNGNLDCVSVLLTYNADIEGQREKVDDRRDKCYSPMFAAAAHGHVAVLSCLVENGADVNTRSTDNNFTPLMIASKNGYVNAVTFLVEQGANMDLQDRRGNTALYFAVCNNSSEVAHKLLSLGASQLSINKQLTPLLLASKRCMTTMVESLIERPECTKEQRIDALELLGASWSTDDTVIAFEYMKRGMEERFQDPSHPLLKQPMEPVEAYQNRKESQTLEELAQIEGDAEAILMESLVIMDRILGGTDSIALLRPIRFVGMHYERHENFDVCIGLYKRLMEISVCCDHKRTLPTYLTPLLLVFYKMITTGVPPRQKILVEILELTYLKCEREVKLKREREDKSLDLRLNTRWLFDLLSKSLELLQVIAKVVRCEEDENSRVSVFLGKFSYLNPRDEQGNTLLHLAAAEQRGSVITDHPPAQLGFPCTETAKLLLNAGFNVNAFNNNGDTPLHRAVTFTPSDDKIHVLTDLLDILLDGGAHHDFVNNDGKTAMDMAATDEARRILSERKTLELKCIAARAVKKFGLPYLGVVPKMLERYISMH